MYVIVFSYLLYYCINIVHTNYVTSSHVFVYNVTGLYFDVVCYSDVHLYSRYTLCIILIYIIYIYFSDLNPSRNKRTTV